MCVKEATSVEELEDAVSELSPDDLQRFATWFDLYRSEQQDDEWDRQIKADAEAGRLDELAEQARAHYRDGNVTDLSGTPVSEAKTS